MKKEFYTITEFAQILGISRVAVFNKIKKGNINASKIGNMFVIPKKELDFILGKELSKEQEKQIDMAMDKAMEDYRETFELLGKV